MSGWGTRMCAVMLASGMVSGCNAVDLVGKTGFSQPSPTGNITVDLGSRAKQYKQLDSDGDGYTLKVGATNKKLVALSGVVPGSDPGAEVKSGSGKYYGTFVLGGFQDVKLKGTSFEPNAMADAGTIVLDADFDKQTITGTGQGITSSEAEQLLGKSVDDDILRGGELRVDGKIEGTEITGQVVYEGVPGALEGIVGDEQAIGAYHGKGGDIIYAGGFSTESDLSVVADKFCAVNSCAGMIQH